MDALRVTRGEKGPRAPRPKKRQGDKVTRRQGDRPLSRRVQSAAMVKKAAVTVVRVGRPSAPYQGRGQGFVAWSEPKEDEQESA